MRKNSFTKNTIIILLLLCAIVTPFARDHKNEETLSDNTTQSVVSPLPEENVS